MSIDRRLYGGKGDRAYYILIHTLLGGAVFAVLYPLIYVISSSFSSPAAVLSGRVWLFPVEPSLEGYRAVFRHRGILTGYGNTLFYTTFGTLVNLCMTIAAAYPLARKDLQGRNLIMFLFSFTMLFSGGLIPTYLLMNRFGLLDSRLVMILPNAIGVWNLIVARTFFQHNIPSELREAAAIDGCNDIRFLLQVVLPVSRALIAVIALFYAVGHWNAFFDAFIYLSDRTKFPLQLFLREILVMNEIAGSMLEIDPELAEKLRGLANLLKYSLIIVASLPVWIIYPFVQKQFVKGVMIGAIKG